MPSHTPGPWTYETDVQNDEPQHVIVGGLAKPDGAVIIARLHHSETSDAEANARLIASAPALLEALQGLYDVVDEGGVAVGKALDKARAAIRQAKGGNNG